jgi:hypothetical protein
MKKTVLGCALLLLMTGGVACGEDTVPAPTGMVDKSPPMSGINFGDPHYIGTDGTMFATPVTPFEIKALDALSGVARSEYRLDGGTWIPYKPFTVAAEGRHFLEYRSVDNAGNVEAPRSFPFEIDSMPPETVLEFNGRSFPGGTTVVIARKSNFALKASDSVSGVKSTEYRIDNGNWRAYAPFVLNSDTNHTVYFRSKDFIGNLEEEKKVAIIVDKVAPVTQLVIGEPNTTEKGKLYVAGTTQFTLKQMQNESAGVVSEYRIDDGEWTPYVPFTVKSEGKHQVFYRSTNLAGITEQVKSLTIIVDNTPPVITIVQGARKLEPGGEIIINKAAQLTLQGTDNLSGVKSREYRINKGEWQAAEQFKISVDGRLQIDFRGSDYAGNVSEIRTVTAVVDNTPPVTDMYVGLPRRITDGVVYVNGSTVMVPKAKDELSGVDRIEYWIVGKGEGRDSVPFTIITPGKYRINFQSFDKAGNAEKVKTIVVVVDPTLPVVNNPAVVSKGSEGLEGLPAPIVFNFEEKYAAAKTNAGAGVKRLASEIDVDPSGRDVVKPQRDSSPAILSAAASVAAATMGGAAQGALAKAGAASGAASLVASVPGLSTGALAKGASPDVAAAGASAPADALAKGAASPGVSTPGVASSPSAAAVTMAKVDTADKVTATTTAGGDQIFEEISGPVTAKRAPADPNQPNYWRKVEVEDPAKAAMDLKEILSFGFINLAIIIGVMLL